MAKNIKDLTTVTLKIRKADLDMKIHGWPHMPYTQEDVNMQSAINEELLRRVQLVNFPMGYFLTSVAARLIDKALAGNATGDRAYSKDEWHRALETWTPRRQAIHQ